MQHAIHDALNKLRLISRLREEQSLSTTSGNISIYDFTVWNWLVRKFYNDNKSEVTRWLLDFYINLDQITEQLISDICNGKDEVKKNRLIEIAVTLAERIKCSVIGIENLSKTYSPYPKTVAELDGLIQDFLIITYRHLMHVLPNDKLTKILRENVVYHGVLYYIGLDHTMNMIDNEHKQQPQIVIDAKNAKK